MLSVMSSDDPRYAEASDASGEPLRNTALIEAMRNVSVADTPETRTMLFRLLLETSLLAVTPSSPSVPRSWTASGGDTIDLVMLSDSEGSVLPLFTSAAAVSRWRPEGGGYAAMPARAIFEMAANNGTNKIALDPGSPTNGYLTRYEIEQLARGRVPLGQTDVVAEETEVRIGKPATPPSNDALDALRTQLQNEPKAERAWYFLMQQGTQAPELFVAIQFASNLVGDLLHQAMRRVIDGAGQQSESVRALSFLVADEQWQDSMTSGSGEQFFSRS